MVEIVNLNDRRPNIVRSGNLNPPGGGGSFDGMEPRVAQLEKDVREIKADTKTVLTDLAYLRGKFEGFDSHLKSIPTIWQLIPIVFTILGTTLGGAFLILRLVSRIPDRLVGSDRVGGRANEAAIRESL
jgi:hypothetical protein